jgi:uncharacterized membrane protein
MPAVDRQPTGRALAAGALVGAASGLRSQMGLAVLARRVDPKNLPSFLRSERARRFLLVAASGELVADKLPFTPSRLDPPGLGARLLLGGVAGALVAADADRGTRILVAAVSAATAAAAAKVGHDLRAKLDERLPDLVVAPIEDAVAVGLAAAGTRLALG